MNINPAEVAAGHEGMTEPGQPAACVPQADFGKDGSDTGMHGYGSHISAEDLFMFQDILLRAARLNADLRLQGVSTTHVDDLVHYSARLSELPGAFLSGKKNCNNDNDRARFGMSVSQLRHDYRKILIREYLPSTTAKEVLDMAQQLDRIAGSLGYY